MDHKREHRTPSTSNGHGSGETTTPTTWGGYGGGYGGLSESGLCVFRQLCPVSFLVVDESPSVSL